MDRQIGGEANDYNYHVKKPNAKSQQQQKLMGSAEKPETSQSQKEMQEDQRSFNRRKNVYVAWGMKLSTWDCIKWNWPKWRGANKEKREGARVGRERSKEGTAGRGVAILQPQHLGAKEDCHINK